MRKNLIKTIVAVAGIIGATLLTGCETKEEPVQDLYGVPADMVANETTLNENI